MTETPEVLAETPMFATDAFSEVLDIVHVRGETARVVTHDGPLEFDIPAGKPCVYIVEQGGLEIKHEGEQPVVLHEKQIALMLQGTAHKAVFSDPRRNSMPGRLVDLDTRARLQPAINCFCGSFTVDGDLAARVLQSLPKVIVLDGLAENPIEWVDVMCELVLRELGETRPGASLMVSRLLDLLLVVILRRWAQSDESLPGWLAAAKDERIARAVAAIHSNVSGTLTELPQLNWSAPMFRKRRTMNDKQATEAGRDSFEVTAS